jgi:HSP20 family molecular chaperone IbpA
MKQEGNAIITKTDDRMIVDFVLPGVPKEALALQVRKEAWNGARGQKGHDFILKVRNPAADDAELFGYDVLVCRKLTQTVSVDVEFDITKIHWTFKDGVVRVSIPKADFAIGLPVIEATEAYVPRT